MGRHRPLASRLAACAASCILTGGLAVALPGAAHATVTTYSTRSDFLTANPGVITDDLSALTSYAGGVVAGPLSAANGLKPGMTYQAGSGSFFVDSPNWSTLSNPTNRILDNKTGGTITLLPGDGITAIAFDLSSLFSSDTAIISTYDSSGLIDTSNIAAASSGTGDFFGISSTTAITSITITESSSNSVDIGNVSYNYTPVPEPASFACLATGLVGLAASRRSRKARAGRRDRRSRAATPA